MDRKWVVIGRRYLKRQQSQYSKWRCLPICDTVKCDRVQTTKPSFAIER